MTLKIINKKNIRQLSIRKKTASRICAVQVLYASSFCLNNIDFIIKSYFENYLHTILLDLNIKNIDEDLFYSIIKGVDENNLKIDEIITENLSEKWSIERLSKTEISVFRLAVYELCYKLMFSKTTVINEYISIFEAFGGNTDFANGILENISQNKNVK